METYQTDEKLDCGQSRNTIALIITWVVISATIIICFYCLFKDDMTFVGQTLMPLWGTWIGTVLAFYFGKNNFEAATKSYRDVIKSLTPDEKIAQIPVKDAMIQFYQIECLEYEKEKDNYINDILKYDRFKKYNRYAVFEKKNIFKSVIHRSTFTQFIAQKVDESKSNDEIKKLTLQNILDEKNNDIKNMLAKGYGFVSIKATLLDAKKLIDNISECQDVFVTETGKESEPVLGLITNNLILDKARV